MPNNPLFDILTEEQRVHYVLLAMEAEMWSEQATSTYIREACLRLSRFWTAQAAQLPHDGNGAQKFEAPRRPNPPLDVIPGEPC